MKKPRIVRKIIRSDNDELIEINIKSIVKKVGESGYIALPNELIGKYVEINLRVLE